MKKLRFFLQNRLSLLVLGSDDSLPCRVCYDCRLNPPEGEQWYTYYYGFTGHNRQRWHTVITYVPAYWANDYWYSDFYVLCSPVWEARLPEPVWVGLSFAAVLHSRWAGLVAEESNWIGPALLALWALYNWDNPKLSPSAIQFLNDISPKIVLNRIGKVLIDYPIP